MKTLVFLFTFITAFIVRSLRWLSITQQKEYRLDRLLLFLKTKEGGQEFLRIFPKRKDFSRTGLKRPKITARVIIVTIIYFFLQLIFIYAIFNYLIYAIKLDINPFVILFIFLLSMLVDLLFIPTLIYLSVLPTSIIYALRVFIELMLAKLKVQKSKPFIIGITGSYGKTSTKVLLSHVLQKKYTVFKTPKSYNTKLSVARSIRQGFNGEQVMVLEYGAYKKGEIKAIASWFKPNMAVITGLAKQHLGLFGSLEAVIRAKSELVSALNPGSMVICNGEDKGVLKICQASENNQVQLINDDNKDKRVNILKAHLNKQGKLVFVWSGQQVVTNFIGLHYLEIVKMTILVAIEMGVSEVEIVQAISEFVPDDKFIYSYQSKKCSLVIDDGNTTNPKGFKAAIELAKSVDISKKTLITPGIVDLGEESKKIHLDLAEKSKGVFTKVLYVGEVGKTEFQVVFGQDLISDQEKVIAHLSSAGEDELVLVEGRMPWWVLEYLK